ncbi:DUF4270 family protein [Mucilaginibacter myungsuensis]|uniref:DUF4270 family protein n=1 Tax=Mucilaginibacter myungsuensis TaxID=649104 RepID=A0A929PY34_9SPHI|nr:DUF4270 family protein [Mucilaginibacter myungsuensis]MBE9663816.1 DUF4270 family protein [Mucilaginibacter myungsuensis]MDN3598469.1 DUF4270 family protein [Mucilaginibacter myungsuensis]
MKFFRIDLLTLLISLFILSGCKNQDGIGLAPEQPLSGSLYVDTNIIVNTEKEDDIYTTSYIKTPVGFLKDPELGTTGSDAAFALNLPGTVAYTIPTGTITVDSAVLVLRYNGDFYGDSLTSRFKVNVYQLNERPLVTNNYFSSYNWDYRKSILLGSRTFSARPRTPFKIMDVVKGGADTLKRVPAHIRVPIDPDFIKNNFFGADPSVLSSNTLFQNYIKGLYVAADSLQAGNGGMYALTLDSSSVAVYYRSNTGGLLDTGLVALPVGHHASRITHNFSAPVKAALANKTTTSSTFYIQGVLGLRTRIQFPNLAEIKAKAGGDIVINRAELVITPNAGTTIPFRPIQKITMYGLDLAKQRILLPDATGASSTSLADPRFVSVTAFGGYYGAYAQSPNEYHFVITGFIQDLMSGKLKDNGTYLGAVDASNFTSVDYLAAPQALGRLVAAGTVTDKTSPNFNGKIKLNVIYTKLTK